MSPLRRTLQLAAHAIVVIASSSVLADVTKGGEVKVDSEKSEVTAPMGKEDCIVNDRTCSLQPNNDYLKQCGVWLAPSSLPGAGLGIYAGRSYADGEQLLLSGDVVIPMVDVMMHQRGRKRFIFLWDEYTWNGKSQGMGHEVMKECNAASPGFGAAANSFLDLVNVEEEYPRNTIPSGMHRFKDPGVGAFSTYHDRRAVAKVDIKQGQELFVNYGQHWFTQRSRLGPIPIRRGLKKSTLFYRKFKRVRDDNPKVPSKVYEELWDEFVKRSEWNESRIFGAFYHTENERNLLDQNFTLKQIRIQDSTRSQDWLAEHGSCADNLFEDVSTIRQAGRGAFASRTLPQGAVVSHLPLIQIVDQTVLEMYALQDIKTKKRAQRTRVGYQLILNYCFGHLNSTMLLCPYGPIASLVNHNQTRVNVKLQWSDPQRSNHVPELLDVPIEEFATDRTARLAMDLVATRQIEEGEEIFLDYGDDWEKAWQSHVENWDQEGEEDYISAFMLNEAILNNSAKFRTEFEQVVDPYPGNVNVECDSNIWRRINRTLFETTHVVDELDPEDYEYWVCDILRHREVNGTTLYTVIVSRPPDDKKKKVDKNGNEPEPHLKLTDIPTMAIRFTDRPYTSDMFLEQAFRHSILIPDEIFPKQWMNFSPVQKPGVRISVKKKK